MPKDAKYLSLQKLGSECKPVKLPLFLQLHQEDPRLSRLMAPSPRIQSLRQLRQLYPAHNIKSCKDLNSNCATLTLISPTPLGRGSPAGVCVLNPITQNVNFPREPRCACANAITYMATAQPRHAKNAAIADHLSSNPGAWTPN